MSENSPKKHPISRFDYVAYDQEAQSTQNLFKAQVQDFEHLVNIHIDDPRSKALAMTHLEEVYMWIGKGIRNDQINRNGSAELQEERKNG